MYYKLVVSQRLHITSADPVAGRGAHDLVWNGATASGPSARLAAGKPATRSYRDMGAGKARRALRESFGHCSTPAAQHRQGF